MKSLGTEHMTPKAWREVRKAAFARAVAVELANAGRSKRAIAADAGYSDTLLDHYADPEHDASLPAHDLLVLDADVALPLLDHIEHARGRVALDITDLQNAGDLSSLAKAAKESAEAIGAHARSLEDKSLEALALLEREAADAVRVFAAIREYARAERARRRDREK